jgi:hypothetical protein
MARLQARYLIDVRVLRAAVAAILATVPMSMPTREKAMS